VNNAGTSHLGLFQDMTPEEWDRLIRTDLSSVFYMTRLAVPRMLSLGHGKIINVSSVWGASGASCEAAYSAAKGGVNALTRALAKELAPSHIQVNAVAPGTIDTEMNAWLSAEDRAALEEEIPAGRFGTAGEAAQVILMLAEGPEYLTGQIVTVSGGWQI
jgi:3-oxoacyl-[acyl-carrier protein] reductase